MNLRLPSRALVPVVVLAVLAGIVATFIVYRTLPTGAESSLNSTAVTPRKTAKPKPAAPKAKPKAKAKAGSRSAAKPKPAPVVTPAPVRKPIEQPKGDPVDANGLPLVLARALAKEPVVVVALYAPNAAVDELVLAEARAGARDAGAGFVAIDVANESQSRPLANLLGVLENPTVLVYRRPNGLSTRLDGFSDRETVAQAAANAAR